MKFNLLVSAAMITATLGSAPAIAEDGAAKGTAGGAVTGPIVGGPVGAAVGGVAGAIVDTALDPPPREVAAYVEQQPIPTDSVVVEGTIAVGKSLPETVVLTPVQAIGFSIIAGVLTFTGGRPLRCYGSDRRVDDHAR